MAGSDGLWRRVNALQKRKKQAQGLLFWHRNRRAGTVAAVGVVAPAGAAQRINLGIF